MTIATVRVRAIRQETADTRTIELDAPELLYTPGQFLTLVKVKPGQEIRRPYSFSSHPQVDAFPAITVKRVPNGEMSRWLCDDIRVGDELMTSGVSGLFSLPSNTTPFKQVLLLAAGSGITPLYSILKEVLLHHSHLKVVLVYSNRSAQSTIFLEPLRSLAATYPTRLSIEFLFSDAKDLRKARLGKYVLEDIFHRLISDPFQTLSFICGPLDYRQMAIITLLNEGVPAEQIRKEIFHTPPVSTRQEPPDKDPHRVTILRNGKKRHQMTVQYPQTILQAAKDALIELPFSCEAGRCGTCAANCVEGTVWMSRNEVLLDREVSDGRILTCTGYPVGGDVHLTF